MKSNVALGSLYAALQSAGVAEGGQSWELKDEFKLEITKNGKKVKETVTVEIEDETKGYVQISSFEWKGQQRKATSVVFINPDDDSQLLYIPIWGKAMDTVDCKKFILQFGEKKDGSNKKLFAVPA